MSLTDKLAITDVDLKGKRVLMRVDFNVSQDEQGNITSTQRIVGAMPTIKYTIEHGAKSVVLMSHFGRPEGKVNEEFTMKRILPDVEKLLGKKVTLTKDCVGPEVEDIVNKTTDGNVVLLENLRFHWEEEAKALEKAKKNGDEAKVEELTPPVEQFRANLTKLGDVYINDAFGTAHRAHSSMVGCKQPQRAAGLLMARELEYFAKALENPKRPFLAILGGSKVRDKIQLIDNLLDKVNMIILTGGMAFTFKKTVQNVKIGDSIFDTQGSEQVHTLLDKAKKRNVEVILPVDYITRDESNKEGPSSYATDETGIPDGWAGLDVGEKTVKMYKSAFDKAETVVWNGPPGVFEQEKYANGTKQTMDFALEQVKKGKIVIIGGGDTATVAVKYGVEDQLSHVSTGGGASLELLEGKELPGIAKLSDKS